MATSILAVTAASWAVVMGLAPLLQLRRMLERRSSDDISIGYLLLLLPGFALWVAYGVAAGNAALVVPNTVAFAVGALTAWWALRLRREGAVAQGAGSAASGDEARCRHLAP